MNKLIISVIAGGALLLNAAPAFASEVREPKVNICQASEEGWQAKEVKESQVGENDFTYAGPLKEDGKIDKELGNDWCNDNVPQVKYCLDKETLSQDFNKDLPEGAVAGACVVAVPPVVVPPVVVETPKATELPNTGFGGLGLGLLGLVVAGTAGVVRFVIRKK